MKKIDKYKLDTEEKKEDLINTLRYVMAGGFPDEVINNPEKTIEDLENNKLNSKFIEEFLLGYLKSHNPLCRNLEYRYRDEFVGFKASVTENKKNKNGEK